MTREAGERHEQKQVENGGEDERRGAGGPGLNDQSFAQQFGDTHHRADNGFLQQRHKLTGQRRHGSAESLRENNESEGLERAEAQRTGSFDLTIAHSTHTGTQDLTEERTVVQSEGEDTRHHERQINADEGRAVVDEGNEHDGRQGTEHVHISGNETRHHLVVEKAHQGKENTQPEGAQRTDDAHLDGSEQTTGKSLHAVLTHDFHVEEYVDELVPIGSGVAGEQPAPEDEETDGHTGPHEAGNVPVGKKHNTGHDGKNGIEEQGNACQHAHGAADRRFARQQEGAYHEHRESRQIGLGGIIPGSGIELALALGNRFGMHILRHVGPHRILLRKLLQRSC